MADKHAPAPRIRARSGQGEPRHNSTHFTRGSQLIGHQWSMLWRAGRMPFLAWIGSFLGLLWLRLFLILDDHEFRMVSMRSLSWLWDHIGFDPMKRVNVTLADGSIRQTYMGYVPFMPEVQESWTKFVGAFVGSAIIATGITALFTLWFVMHARSRSKAMMEEHHERGSELTSRAHLVSVIERHNEQQVRKIAAREYPGMAFAKVLDLPREERARRNLLRPCSIATVPFPHGREQNHVMVFGTTGAGKTTVLRDLISQAVERGQNCVIFDLTGHYVEAFYDEKRDHILNLTDKRCRNWSVFHDCDTQAEFVAAASALIPDEDGADGGFWERAARMLFVEMCVKLKAEGQGTNKALSDKLLTAKLSDIYAKLKGTVADPLTSPDAARMANSIRGVLNSHGDALRFLPTEGPAFSIRDWVRDEGRGGSNLFITSRHVDMPLNRALVSAWMNIAIHTLMTMPHTARLRTWYVFDELGALHQLPALEDGLQTARSFGGAFVLGVHSLARLRMTYGEEGARNITSLAFTKVILATGDAETADECSKLIGTRQVRTMDEAYSYGAHEARDASTISPSRREEPLVFPDDIMSLPNLHAYLRFREGFPAAYVQVPYVAYPAQAQGYLPAPPPPLVAPHDDGDEESEAGEGGRGAQTAAAPDVAQRDADRPLADLADQGSPSPDAAAVPPDGLHSQDQLAGQGASSAHPDQVQPDIAPDRAVTGREPAKPVSKDDELAAGKLAKREMAMSFRKEERDRGSALDLDL
ncbi:type IV conjugative transfer system coupling protein TraD [Sphingobium sp. B1D7B]|uniref:type IV secretion system DNA-binding domain-containing protein n=1 Tax=Sphingobium sp. B1D7B TaxID=2940578 RepID=UPI00222452F8|nr:type IV secretion system DNA-binding domain-containing protein [Sphingobium sp. B1D7B]MCW2406945.1 type IV conjugative transfer system coupling protein TraD [Sphingobium sp. B1D7B]